MCFIVTQPCLVLCPDTTPSRSPQEAEKRQLELEDSVTPGYDVVKIKSPSGASKPVEQQQQQQQQQQQESRDKVGGGQEHAVTRPANLLQYEDLDSVIEASEPPPAYPTKRLAYEDVEQLSEPPFKWTSNKIGYEDVDNLASSRSQARKQGQFQIKVAKEHQPASKTEGETATPPGDVNLLYSAINKPKANKKPRDGSNTPPAKAPLPTYALVNKPKKRKKSLAGSSTLPMTEAVSEEAKAYKTETPSSSITIDSVIDGASLLPQNLDGDYAPYKNVASSPAAPMDQPLYSNCREIDEMKFADLGEVSSREPAPPPIRSYSASWGSMARVNHDEVSTGSTEKSTSPEGQ